MSLIPNADIRETLLKIVHDMQKKSPNQSSLQQGSVLNEAAKRLKIGHDPELEMAVLTLWSDLFRTGYLAWGLNLTNPNAPFFHITERGRQALQRLSRDPGNPAGYLTHLTSVATLNAVAKSYLEEGLACFTAGLHKSAAVMIGAASESIVLELRDIVETRLTSNGATIPKALQDWRVKAVNDALSSVLTGHAAKMPHDLRAEFGSFWPAFTQQIRVTRNEAGHPTSVDPVPPDTVHASFLVFPEIARMATKLIKWIPSNL